jgi:hypothetical protein
MAIKSEDPKEYIAALGDISSLLNGNLSLGSANIANLNKGGAFGGALNNIINIAKQQQKPQLGPDEFGSYVIPPSDPTYSSGFDYARSIAGGIPMSQVIAPGVSYSPEQPMGYTQEQLNLPKDVDIPPPPPPILPPTREPDDPRYFGTGIGGVNIPVDRKQDFPPLSNLLNIGKLFDGGFDKDAIDKIVQERIAESMPTFEQPDLSQFVTKQDIPSFIPDIPTGREFSIEDIQQGLNLPDFSQFARQEDIPTPNVFDEEALRKELMEDIRGSINIPQIPDLSGLARLEDIPQYQAPDLSGFARLEDIPSFDPSVLKQDILMSIPQQQVPDVSKFVTQDDISKAIAGIDMPTFQQPDLTAYDTRLAQLEEQLAGFKQPTGGRFSVDQQLPMGLF